MNIIIPMAGAGKRFADEGYKTSKPAIPTTDRRTGKKVPMVVCAVMDIPGVMKDGENVTFIDRDFHKQDGTEDIIKQHFPKAGFITVNALTEGQACTCLLARDKINSDEPLFIAGCDNGMAYDRTLFDCAAAKCDVLAFTYRHNPAVLRNPCAYGWLAADSEGRVTRVSVKKPLSEDPMNDHAIVASFRFRRGRDFVSAADKMISENDRVNGEFYVDKVLSHCLLIGQDVRVFEIDRYIGWGTPRDYEDYEATINYWKEFTDGKDFIPGDK